MADNSAKIVRMARVLAIAHIIVGSLLTCFGIADLMVQIKAADSTWGIWMGVWMCVAGVLGIPGTRKERSTSRNYFASVFMGFSITSAVFGGFIIISYSMRIAGFSNRYNRLITYDTQMALMALISILGIVEFAIGIWAAVCLCLMKPCTCCRSTPAQQGQMMYNVYSGYTMNPFPVCAATASPMQAAGSMVAVHTTTPGSQQVQPQMVMVPVSEAAAGMFTTQNVTPGSVGSPPQVVMVPVARTITYPPQAPTSAATTVPTATVYQHRHSEML